MTLHGNICYHLPMPRGLSDHQIERVAQQLYCVQNRVTVRDVMQALRVRFGGCGRTERICRILRTLEAQRQPLAPLPADRAELERLREQLGAAQERARLSEERERQHQDLWATRYAEKLAELEKKLPPRVSPQVSGVSHDQYLRVYQRAAELARRLAKYENPDKPELDTIRWRPDATTTD